MLSVCVRQRTVSRMLEEQLADAGVMLLQGEVHDIRRQNLPQRGGRLNICKQASTQAGKDANLSVCGPGGPTQLC